MARLLISFETDSASGQSGTSHEVHYRQKGFAFGPADAVIPRRYTFPLLRRVSFHDSSNPDKPVLTLEAYGDSTIKISSNTIEGKLNIRSGLEDIYENRKRPIRLDVYIEHEFQAGNTSAFLRRSRPRVNVGLRIGRFFRGVYSFWSLDEDVEISNIDQILVEKDTATVDGNSAPAALQGIGRLVPDKRLDFANGGNKLSAGVVRIDHGDGTCVSCHGAALGFHLSRKATVTGVIDLPVVLPSPDQADAPSPFVVRVPVGTSLTFRQLQMPGGAVGEAGWLLFIEGIPTSAVVAGWRARHGADAGAAVRSTRGDRPISLFPDFIGGSNESTWSIIIPMIDRTKPETSRTMPKDWQRLPIGFLVIGDMRDHFASQMPPKVLPKLTLDMTTPRFRSHQNRALPVLLPVLQERIDIGALRDTIRAGERLPSNGRPQLPAIALKIAEKAASDNRPAADTAVARLGAYDLELPAHPTARGGKDSELAIWFTQEAVEPGPASLHYSMKLDLPLSRLLPGAQDLPESSQLETWHRASPIVIPRGRPPQPGTQGTEAALTLKVEETARPGERQQLSVTVESTSEVVPPVTALVLDHEPFLVAQVNVPLLRPRGEGATLARWSSDGVEGSGWTIQVQDDADAPTRSQGFDLVLPPQAVGETMIKGAKDVPPNGPPADFRFGRPVRLSVHTSLRREMRAAVEPPHNLRRLFGDATQRSPGAPVVKATFELLYGLEASLDAHDLLISELTAEYGRLPKLIEPPNAEDGTEAGNFHRHWSNVHQSFARRLAVLSLRRTGDAIRQDLDEGLSFTLRRDAEVKLPVPLRVKQLDPVKDPPYTIENGKPHRAGLPNDELLPGGAEWGFDSSTIFKSVWRNLDQIRDRGQASDVHFSALGGWGYQRAQFDDGKTAIISHTAMGRTHFYSLERVGRIARYWNRARHVIVYERTVAPSRQFRNGQPNLLGLPMLHKVAEYVEILQPERTYPENGAAFRERGFVQASHFRSTVIPVDSAWGEDLAGHGWRVRLWNRAADPDVYSKPQVDLRVAAVGGNVAHCSIDEGGPRNPGTDRLGTMGAGPREIRRGRIQTRCGAPPGPAPDPDRVDPQRDAA